MGLAGWEGCSQLQGRATGLSIRNWRQPQAAELSSGLPRNRTEGREVPGGYTVSCGVSPSMTIGEEQAAKWQIPKQPGRAREKKAAQLIQGGCTGEIQAKREVWVGVLKAFSNAKFLVSGSLLVSWDPLREAISTLWVSPGLEGDAITGNGEGRVVMARAKGVARWTGCFAYDTCGLTMGLLS